MFGLSIKALVVPALVALLHNQEVADSNPIGYWAFSFLSVLCSSHRYFNYLDSIWYCYYTFTALFMLSTVVSSSAGLVVSAVRVPFVDSF